MKNYRITVNGKEYDVQVEEIADGMAPLAKTVAASPAPTPVQAKPAAPQAPKKAPSAAAGKVQVKSPMPGNILKINVSEGKAVKSGEVLCILEAMKMENEIPAPQDGVIATVNVTKGASVGSGDVLFTIS